MTAVGRRTENVVRYLAAPARKLLNRLGPAYYGVRPPAGGSPVLMFHEVDDRQTASYSNGTSPPLFRDIVARLDDRYDVLPLSEFCERLRAGRLRPRHCAITFDDGARSTYVNAYSVLREFDVPATVFLTTGVLDDRRPFWPYVYNFMLNEHPDRFVDICREEYGNPFLRRSTVKEYTNYVASREATARVLSRAFDELVPFEAYREREGIDGRIFLNGSEVREMAGLVEFGVHTASHPTLRKLDTAGIREELAEPFDRIREILGDGDASVPILSVPFGGLGTAYGPRVVRVARRLGFEFLVSAYGGTNPSTQPPWAVRRVPVSDDLAGDGAEAFVESLPDHRPRLADRLSERYYADGL